MNTPVDVCHRDHQLFPTDPWGKWPDAIVNRIKGLLVYAYMFDKNYIKQNLAVDEDECKGLLSAVRNVCRQLEFNPSIMYILWTILGRVILSYLFQLIEYPVSPSHDTVHSGRSTTIYTLPRRRNPYGRRAADALEGQDYVV
jgi:hypothetical protein